MRPSYICILFIVLVFGAGCLQKTDKFKSPSGYDLNHPIKYSIPDILNEVSGIAFLNGDSSMLYAEQDEQGKVFYLKPGDKRANHTKFGKNGDYEDISVCNNYVIMLHSDGTLFTFPFGEVGKPDAGNVQEFNKLLPKGEYEGLYGDNTTGEVYVLCKHCKETDPSVTGNIYTLQLAPDGRLSSKRNFEFPVKDIASLTGDQKMNFHPSALALHPFTLEWFIISSVNKLLVIADRNWNIKAVYRLNPSLYIQPEGIAFDKYGNLYISNEGNKTTRGNVLKMAYHRD